MARRHLPGGGGRIYSSHQALDYAEFVMDDLKYSERRKGVPGDFLCSWNIGELSIKSRIIKDLRKPLQAVGGAGSI